MAEGKIDSLSIEIGASSTKAISSINRLTKALGGLRSALSGESGETFTKLGKLADALGKLSAVGRVSINSKLPDQIRELSRAVSEVSDDVVRKIDQLTTALERLKGLNLKGFSSVVDSFTPKETGLAKNDALIPVKQMTDPIKEAAAMFERDFAPASNIIDGIIQETDQVATTSNRASQAIKDLGNRMRELFTASEKTRGPLSNFLSMIKRIAMYRMIRSIIKAITDAFKQGLQGAYTFSSRLGTEGHRFASAMDSMTSASYTMKAQLGSAFISLLTIIAPVVNTIISLITTLANAMSQLFAAFTGGTYLKATDNGIKFADTFKNSAGGSADAAEEWKNQLLGFDEINRLEDTNGRGGGGGGGGGSPDLSDLFEEAEIEGIFVRIRDKILELINSLNFEPLIAAWERLKEAVKGFADVILDYLAWAWDNILVPLAHWVIEEAAPRLVTLLATAFELLTAVLEKLKPVFEWVWENVLKPIANFIGDAFLKFLDELIDLFQDLTDLLNGKISFSEFIHGLDGVQVAIIAVCVALGAMGLIGLIKNLVDTVLVGLFLAIGKVTTLFTSFNMGIFLVIAGIVALVAAIYDWISTGELSENMFMVLEAGIMAVGVGLSIMTGSWIPLLVAAVVAATVAIVTHWDQIIEAFKNFQQTLHNVLNDGKLSLADFAATAIKMIMAPIDAIINLINFIVNLINWIRNLVAAIGSAKSSISSMSSMSNSSKYGYGMFASGGFPDEGQMFVAREAGPELVGTMNGRTAVANNQEIVKGIEGGVYRAVIAALGSQGSSSKGSREIVLNINGREFARAIYDDQRAVNREHGTRLVNNA